jgi:RimJ/RimL family protein N-acetyltransferase
LQVIAPESPIAPKFFSGRGQFLTDIDASVEAQKRWLQGYLQDESQAYFVIHDVKTCSPVGLVRMYGPRGNFFSWGSWIFLPGVDSFFAFESAMLIYQYAFLLGFESAYFDVRRANTSVRRFHEKLGAVEVSSDPRDVFYEFYGPDIRAAFGKSDTSTL